MKKLVILTGKRHSGKSTISLCLEKRGVYYIDFDNLYELIKKKESQLNILISNENQHLFQIFREEIILTLKKCNVEQAIIDGVVIGDSKMILGAIISAACELGFIYRLFFLHIPEIEREVNYYAVRRIYNTPELIKNNNLDSLDKHIPRYAVEFEKITNIIPVHKYLEVGEDKVDEDKRDFYQSFDFPFFVHKGLTESSSKWQQISSWLPVNMESYKCIDIGCNEGYFALRIASRGASVVGIDYNPEIAAIAKKIVSIATNFKVEIINDDVYSLKKMSSLQFDYSICLSLLHHVPLFDTIKQISRITKIRSIFEVLVDNSLTINKPYCLVTDNPVPQEIIPSPLALTTILSKFYKEVQIINPNAQRLIVVCDK